jgi:hypothetical protein
MNRGRRLASVTFSHSVSAAYRKTRLFFESLKDDAEYTPYVVPKSTAPKVGFAIFYTSPVFRPELLIIGQNPANFAGPRRSWQASPNAEMLSGTPPNANSYEEHEHDFAVSLRNGFRRHNELLSHAVGMNIWHFQCGTDAPYPPHRLRTFCESITRELVEAIEPRAILCFGSEACDGLNFKLTDSVSETRQSKYADISGRRVWKVRHLTGSRTRLAATHDLPYVVDQIAKFLKESNS